MLEKPEPRKKERTRRRMTEQAVIKKIKAETQARDGRCRYAKVDYSHRCLGISTWAHLEEIRRARTQNWPVDDRHTTRGTLWLCEDIHRAYDTGQMLIEPTGPDGADGMLRFFKRIGEG